MMAKNKYIGKDNSNWKGGKSINKCKYCGVNFLDWICKNRKFCSIDCKNKDLIGKPSWNKGLKCPNISKGKKKYKFTEEHKNNIKLHSSHSPSPMLGKKHTKESIKKIKKARTNQILPVKDTSIEVKIQNFLKQLGITFFTHQYMKIEHGYQCDVLIPSMNLVIECDGDYWHKYPVGREIDDIRTSELLSKGFKVLRLWECEINKFDLHSFKTKLMEVKND